ncbi:MAG: response regulator [Sphingobium sp.]
MGLFSHRIAVSRTKIRTILIVEDEPLVAFDNEHALAQAGYHVAATVDRFDHAVEALADGERDHRAIDLIVADIRLAGPGGGLDVARHAIALEVPVLFSTAACPEEAHLLGIGWIAKPYAPRDLVRAIRVIERVLNGAKPRLVPEMMTLFVTRD